LNHKQAFRIRSILAFEPLLSTVKQTSIRELNREPDNRCWLEFIEIPVLGPDTRFAASFHSTVRTHRGVLDGWNSLGSCFVRAVPLLLGHAKLDSTVRYLGIEIDDALDMLEQVDV